MRQECREKLNGLELEVGEVLVTKGYNLPSNFVFHVPGPIFDPDSQHNSTLLSKSYSNCLNKAKEINAKSIAFCCLSTGVFKYPSEEAAKIAWDTVKKWSNTGNYKLDVIFNVFLDKDRQIYEELLK